MAKRGALIGWTWVTAFGLSAGCMYDYAQYDFEEAPPATTAAEGTDTQNEAPQLAQADAGTL